MRNTRALRAGEGTEPTPRITRASSKRQLVERMGKLLLPGEGLAKGEIVLRILARPEFACSRAGRKRFASQKRNERHGDCRSNPYGLLHTTYTGCTKNWLTKTAESTLILSPGRQPAIWLSRRL
jgi:hypothetical protein